jgi:hypothetical protein
VLAAADCCAGGELLLREQCCASYHEHCLDESQLPVKSDWPRARRGFAATVAAVLAASCCCAGGELLLREQCCASYHEHCLDESQLPVKSKSGQPGTGGLAA